MIGIIIGTVLGAGGAGFFFAKKGAQFAVCEKDTNSCHRIAQFAQQSDCEQFLGRLLEYDKLRGAMPSALGRYECSVSSF